MVTPADPARSIDPPLPDCRGKWALDCGITSNAGVPLSNLRVNVSPLRVADRMGATALDLESALGHAGEAGPEGVHERGVGYGVELAEAWAAGVDPHPERSPATALRDISLTAKLDDHI